MGRKKKYENTLIAKEILSREANALGNMQLSIALRFIDLKKKDDREFLKNNVVVMANIFNDALKELEESKKEDKK